MSLCEQGNRQGVFLKWCSACSREKSSEEFGKLSRSPDGRGTICRPCARSYNATYRDANRSKIRSIAAKWRGANRSLAKSRTEAWKAMHPERQRDAERNYRAENPAKRAETCAQYRRTHVEEEAHYRRRYAKAHRAEINAKAAKRRAAKLCATPSWANPQAIMAIYLEAQRLTEETGIPHHVDHEYPLQSDWVCGLHVETNLRIMIGVENLSKGNRPAKGFS